MTFTDRIERIYSVALASFQTLGCLSACPCCSHFPEAFSQPNISLGNKSLPQPATFFFTQQPTKETDFVAFFSNIWLHYCKAIVFVIFNTSYFSPIQVCDILFAAWHFMCAHLSICDGVTSTFVCVLSDVKLISIYDILAYFNPKLLDTKTFPWKESKT